MSRWPMESILWISTRAMCDPVLHSITMDPTTVRGILAAAMNLLIVPLCRVIPPMCMSFSTRLRLGSRTSLICCTCEQGQHTSTSTHTRGVRAWGPARAHTRARAHSSYATGPLLEPRDCPSKDSGPLTVAWSEVDITRMLDTCSRFANDRRLTSVAAMTWTSPTTCGVHGTAHHRKGRC